ncbi:hypothetical protein ABZ484_19305 [Streptomyces sp. NPDC006393]|uniref:hypothetical protein n=1 Tax=Streptomyces sp. NPDC006393 TaxID=3156763 RepID=UPI0033CD01F1
MVYGNALCRLYVYGLHSGAEGSVEEFVDGHRGRRCRYRGLAKTCRRFGVLVLVVGGPSAL